MTGMYEASLKAAMIECNKRLLNAEDSYDRLANKSTQYAEEHRSLITMYQDVFAVYEQALNSLHQAKSKKG